MAEGAYMIFELLGRLGSNLRIPACPRIGNYKELDQKLKDRPGQGSITCS